MIRLTRVCETPKDSDVFLIALDLPPIQLRCVQLFSSCLTYETFFCSLDFFVLIRRPPVKHTGLLSIATLQRDIIISLFDLQFYMILWTFCISFENCFSVLRLCLAVLQRDNIIPPPQRYVNVFSFNIHMMNLLTFMNLLLNRVIFWRV